MKSMPATGMTGSAAGLRSMAMRLYARIVLAYRCRKAERELLQASDAMLKDIGITRSQIAGAVWLGRDNDTRHLR